MRFQYLFFVSDIAAKSTEVEGAEQFFLGIAEELIKQHKRFLIFNRNMIKRRQMMATPHKSFRKSKMQLGEDT